MLQAPSSGITGPRMSRPMFPEELEKDEARRGANSAPLIELVKDGDVECVRNYLLQHPSSVRETDWDVSGTLS